MILVLKFIGDVSESRIRDMGMAVVDAAKSVNEPGVVLFLRDGEDLNTLPPKRAIELRDLLLKEYPIA